MSDEQHIRLFLLNIIVLINLKTCIYLLIKKITSYFFIYFYFYKYIYINKKIFPPIEI